MSFRTPVRFFILLAALFVAGGTALAQGPVNGASNTTSEVDLQGNIETALRLDIDNDTDGSLAFDFGDMDGLGLNAASAGFSKSTDSNGTLYYKNTPIALSPKFSGFASGSTATITVYASGTHASAARMGTGSVSASDTVSSDSGAQTAVASGLAHASMTNRYIGVYVARSTVAASLDSTLVFKVQVVDPD
jgi:hypothetical protein